MNENDEITTEYTEEFTEEPELFDTDSDPEWEQAAKDIASANREPDGSEDEEVGQETDQSTDEADTGEESEDEAQDEDYWLELKHMDDPVKKVSKEEAKALAQKGLDYDRIRGERDSYASAVSKFKEYEDFLNEIKGDKFDSVEDLMDDTRASLLSDKEEISYDAAMARIKSQRKEKQNNDGSVAAAEFVKAFPQVKSEDIPAEVWAAVRNGEKLVDAYQNYCNNAKDNKIKQLELEIETLKNNNKNSSRTTGSRKSKGANTQKTLAEKLWERDEF